jgi:hypothetical protein
MREINIGKSLTTLRIRENDEILIFTETNVFQGTFKKVWNANMGLSMTATLKNGKKEIVADIEIDSEYIQAIGRTRTDGVHTVSDSIINKDQEKHTE